MDEAASIEYVEGDDFRSGLHRVVSEIYQASTRIELQSALQSAALDAESVLSAIASRPDAVTSVQPEDETAHTKTAIRDTGNTKEI
jgi:hypothetical protein